LEIDEIIRAVVDGKADAEVDSVKAKEFTLEDFERCSKVYWAHYSLTVEQVDIASGPACRALLLMLTQYRWMRVGVNVEFMKMKQSFIFTSAGAGARRLLFSSGGVVATEDEGELVDDAETAGIISAFERKLVSAVHVGCNIVCPVGFLGRERGLLGTGAGPYFITLDPVRRVVALVQRYGRKMRPDSLVTTLHRFEDDIAEGLNGPVRVSLSYMLYEKAPMLSYALSSAAIASVPTPVLPREEASERPASVSPGQRRNNDLSKQDRKRLLSELRRSLADKSARSDDKGGPSSGKTDSSDKGEKYERVQGGNPKNPKQCTKDHAKGAWCTLNHSQKS